MTSKRSFLNRGKGNRLANAIAPSRFIPDPTLRNVFEDRRFASLFENSIVAMVTLTLCSSLVAIVMTHPELLAEMGKLFLFRQQRLSRREPLFYRYDFVFNHAPPAKALRRPMYDRKRKALHRWRAFNYPSRMVHVEIGRRS